MMDDDVLFECYWCGCDDCGGGNGFLGRVCALDDVGVTYSVFSLY